MRAFTFEHGGEEYTMAATFGASVDLAEKVADPLFIAREAAVEAALGAVYQPKFRFTIQNVPQIMAIGLKAGGHALPMSAVQAMVFDIGFREAMDIATRYVAMVITPKSEEVTEIEASDAAPGE